MKDPFRHIRLLGLRLGIVMLVYTLLRLIFYIRNHLPVPEIDKSKYELRIGGEGLKNLVLDMDTLKKNFKKHTIVATIQCTGNRRKDLMDCT